MEYLPGGDLMNLLIKRDFLTETETKFFIAETLLAIHHVHVTGFIHRDIKPDNLLLTRTGHIRLTDFGLSTKLDRYSDPLSKLIDELTEVQDEITSSSSHSQLSREKRRREHMCSAAGTPEYIAPEVLQKHPYGQNVDFWSLGAIMYEMLFGAPPFYEDNDPRATIHKIVRWRDTLQFPTAPAVSGDAIDLIRRLICGASDRLDFEGIKCHRFFSGIDWDNIGNMESPYIPVVTSDTDTSNFDQFEARRDADGDEDIPEPLANLAFMGFRYNKTSANSVPQDVESIKPRVPETPPE
jgi:serine/threonine protein kinase